MSEPPRGRSYGEYLKVPELLQLQKTLSDPPHHDETLFIIIHQVYELWFKQMLHEVDAMVKGLEAGNTRLATRLCRRMIEIQRILIQQIAVLETMTPPDFLQFRQHLNPASGFQSFQFRALEFRSGLKEPRYLEMHKADPLAQSMLQAALAAPSLRDAWEGLLRSRGLAYPPIETSPGPAPLPSSCPAAAPAASAGAGAPGSSGASTISASAVGETTPAPVVDERTAQRTQTLLQVYGGREDLYDLYILAESLIEYDENFLLWRQHHILMVERVIGMKPGTGGSEGVGYLRTTLGRKCFPDLWDVRTDIGSSGTPYGQ